MTVMVQVKDVVHVLTFSQHEEIASLLLAKPGNEILSQKRQVLQGEEISQLAAIEHEREIILIDKLASKTTKFIMFGFNRDVWPVASVCQLDIAPVAFIEAAVRSMLLSSKSKAVHKLIRHRIIVNIILTNGADIDNTLACDHLLEECCFILQNLKHRLDVVR